MCAAALGGQRESWTEYQGGTRTCGRLEVASTECRKERVSEVAVLWAARSKYGGMEPRVRRPGPHLTRLAGGSHPHGKQRPLK